MAKTRRVVVKGGGSNLYEIEETSSRFVAYKIKVGIIMNDRSNIGSARSLEDAIALIRSHSGKEIDRIG